MTKAHYTVTHGRALRLAADPGIDALAQKVKDDIVAATPIGRGSRNKTGGRLAAGWYVTKTPKPPMYPVGVPAVRVIANDVPYARVVEYGGRGHPRPAAMMGRALARYSQFQRPGRKRRRR